MILIYLRQIETKVENSLACKTDGVHFARENKQLGIQNLVTHCSLLHGPLHLLLLDPVGIDDVLPPQGLPALLEVLPLQPELLQLVRRRLVAAVVVMRVARGQIRKNENLRIFDQINFLVMLRGI